MAYRLELTFVGEAPESELERARILGSEAVTVAARNLSDVLEAAGFAHEFRARAVRAHSRPGSGRPAKPRAVAEAAE